MYHSDLSHQDSVLRLVCLGNSFPCFQRSTTASFKMHSLTHCLPDLGVDSRVCVCLCRAFTLQHHALLFAHCRPMSVNSVFNSMPVTLLVPQKCLFECNHLYTRPLNKPEQRSLAPCVDKETRALRGWVMGTGSSSSCMMEAGLRCFHLKRQSFAPELGCLLPRPHPPKLFLPQLDKLNHLLLKVIRTFWKSISLREMRK